MFEKAEKQRLRQAMVGDRVAGVQDFPQHAQSL